MIQPSALTREAFVARYGQIYEHSPWFAAVVWDTAKPDEIEAYDSLMRLFHGAIAHAGREAQRALIRAHPDLAGRVALSPDSSAEQQSAGLGACSLEEFRAFQELNAAYKAKFGFPFIVAVRGLGREAILAAFRRRLGNEPEAEFAAALAEIHNIAGFRLRDIFDGT